MKTKDHFHILCTILLVILCLQGHSEGKQTQVPAAIYQIIDSTEKKSSGKPDIMADSYNDMAAIFENELNKDPKDLWARLNLAYIYQQQFKFRKALEYYLMASEQASNLADPKIGLGRLYYTLAIVDISDRKLIKKSSVGLPIFVPDKRSKEILEFAKRELLSAKKLNFLVKYKGSAKLVVSSPGTADKFLKMTNSHLYTYYMSEADSLEQKGKYNEANKCLERAKKIIQEVRLLNK